MNSTKKAVAEKVQIFNETSKNMKKNVHADVEKEILTKEEAHKYSLVAVEEQGKE